MRMSQTHGHTDQEAKKNRGQCRRCSTWASIENDVAPSIVHGFMTNLLYGFRSGLRHHGLFGHLRAQETIRESRSGDKSDELKVDRSFVHDHRRACAALARSAARTGTPVIFILNYILYRVENGSKNGKRTGVAPRVLWWGVWDCGVECV